MDKGQFLETVQAAWDNIGTLDATASAADITLADTERWVSALETCIANGNCILFNVPKGMNKLETRFLLVTENHDVDIEVWAARKGDNDVTRIATLDVICGDQDHSNGTNQFADTINISNEKWDADVSVVSDTDTMARLYFDVLGYDRIYFHGFGTFDGDTIVECSGY